MFGTYQPVQTCGGRAGRGVDWCEVPMGLHFSKHFPPRDGISAQQEKQSFPIRCPGCLLEEKPTCPQVSHPSLCGRFMSPAPDFVNSLEKVMIMLQMPSDSGANAHRLVIFLKVIGIEKIDVSSSVQSSPRMCFETTEKFPEVCCKLFLHVDMRRHVVHLSHNDKQTSFSISLSPSCIFTFSFPLADLFLQWLWPKVFKYN